MPSLPKKLLHAAALALSPDLRKLVASRAFHKAEHERLLALAGAVDPAVAERDRFLELLPLTLQFRRAFHSIQGRTAAPGALPGAKAWPRPDDGKTYRDKLVSLLPTKDGRGVELGPLNLPLITKSESQVLYVDHLDTAGLMEKYPYLDDIAPVDLEISEQGLAATLQSVAPIDYFVASQVMEHVGNPIRWLQDIASVLRPGGLVSLSLPDRRVTFDLFRQESRASDLVAAFYSGTSAPDVRSVYDHHSQAALINMHWARPESVTPEQVLEGQGSREVILADPDYMHPVGKAVDGNYLDVHAWVFTPPSFLLAMSQLALDGFVPFKLHQFYPTVIGWTDRGAASFTVIMERPDNGDDRRALARSFLEPLWPDNRA